VSVNHVDAEKPVQTKIHAAEGAVNRGNQIAIMRPKGNRRGEKGKSVIDQAKGPAKERTTFGGAKYAGNPPALSRNRHRQRLEDAKVYRRKKKITQGYVGRRGNSSNGR